MPGQRLCIGLYIYIHIYRYRKSQYVTVKKNYIMASIHSITILYKYMYGKHDAVIPGKERLGFHVNRLEVNETI